MNITELHEYLTAALARGLDPNTTVVVDTQSVDPELLGSWQLVEDVEDPTLREDEGLLWLTIYLSQVPADPRFTYGHN